MSSSTLAGLPTIDVLRDEQRLVLTGVSWEEYEALRAALDEHPGVRIYYLEGEVEIVSPSRKHERLKKMIARLVEAYALVRQVALLGLGSTTFRERAKERGLEPDECYCVDQERAVPDIAIEVVVSRGVLDKLSLYAGLGIAELWEYEGGAFHVHVLRDGRYEPRPGSTLLPELDLALLARHAERTDQADAVRDYIRALGGLEIRG